MSRTAPLLALLLILPAPATLRAADEPSAAGKTASEWATLLREGKTTAVRRQALLALQIIGPRRSRRVLPAVYTALREDADPGVRTNAANTLAKMIGKLRDSREKEEPVRLDTTRDALAAAVRTDKAATVRRAAAAALGKMEEEAEPAVGALAAALKDRDPATRSAAADALRRIGKGAKDALPELRAALGDKDNRAVTRAHAALALGRIGDPDAETLGVLKGVLNDDKAATDVRKAVAEALRQMGKDAADAAPDLGKALTSPTAEVELRRAAVEALDEFGPDAKAALPALQKALKDEDKYVRALTLHVIGQLGGGLGDRRKDTVTGVLQSLNDGVLEVRLAAIASLASLGSEGLGEDTKAALERLGEAARDSQKAVREAAQNAIKKIKGS